MRLSQVIVFAKDLERMTSFYAVALGLPIVDNEGGKGWVRLDAGGCMLAIHSIPDKVAKDIQISDPPEARLNNPIKLTFQVDDIDNTRAELMQLGAFMLEVRRFPGLALCNGLDPEGNVFQLSTR